MKNFLVLTLLLATAACYSYAPASLGTVSPGATVRVELSDVGSSEVEPYVGARARTLEGRVTRADSAGLELSVTDIIRSSDLDEAWLGKPVQVPSNGIATVSLSKLSAKNSLLAAGGLFVGAGALARAIVGGSAFGARSTPPPTGK
jgi:hypothetical protein